MCCQSFWYNTDFRDGTAPRAAHSPHARPTRRPCRTRSLDCSAHWRAQNSTSRVTSVPRATPNRFLIWQRRSQHSRSRRAGTAARARLIRSRPRLKTRHQDSHSSNRVGTWLRFVIFENVIPHAVCTHITRFPVDSPSLYTDLQSAQRARSEACCCQCH